MKYFKYVENNITGIHESSIQFKTPNALLCLFQISYLQKTQNIKDTIKQKYNTKSKIQY